MVTLGNLEGVGSAQRAMPRAMSINDFCKQYGIGRTKVYEELKTRRLHAFKAGRRTLITDEAAEAWLRRLPPMEVAR